MTIRIFRAALFVLCAVLGAAAPVSSLAEEIRSYLLGQRLACFQTQLACRDDVRPASFLDEPVPADPQIFDAPVVVDQPEFLGEPMPESQPWTAEELPSAPTAYPSTTENGGHMYGAELSGCDDCSHCTGFAGCGDRAAYCNCCTPGPMFRCYADCELVFARAHVLEGGLGAGPNPMKLSEQYDLSPRTVVGIERHDGSGIRARYWHYGETLADIANPGAAVSFDFDVFDLEAYHRFRLRRADVTLSAGFRAAEIGLAFDNDWHDVTGLGATFAADGESLICCYRNNYWSAVYGARLSLLGGDWSSSGPGIPALRDDNFTVTELYAGVEHGCRVWSSDLYWRLGFEMQNWRSDNLAGNTNTDSIGFVGPSVQFGASY